MEEEVLEKIKHFQNSRKFKNGEEIGGRGDKNMMSWTN